MSEVRIRNFSIIAHIDHGKSTLADRMLEVTRSIDARKMKAQVLDSMDLERERGITIKMQPVRMEYSYHGVPHTLNLIDTPGHIDFSYEVSRALTAVEGVLLLVDATQGIQAQTIATLESAREAGCVVVPVVSKIDAPTARTDEVALEIAELIKCDLDEVVFVSGKTGQGVEGLLNTIVEKIPPPEVSYSGAGGRALVFDYSYSEHRGVVMFVRVYEGVIKGKDKVSLMATGASFQALEVGYITPNEKPADALFAGEIGYIVSGIKEPGIATVGDTVRVSGTPLPALAGYREPRPVVWASVYPESQEGFTSLKHALMRLRLSDSSLSFDEDGSSILGKGFRCGFLGMLHLEIVTERLKREFHIEPIITTPTIEYELTLKNGEVKHIFSPSFFPDHHLLSSVKERWVEMKIMVPPLYSSPLTQLLFDYEAVVISSHLFSDGRLSIVAEMPLRELMRGFFDKLKSVSSGFASFSYEFLDMRPAEVVRLDVLVSEEVVPAFSKIVSRRRVLEEAKSAVERLSKILPRQLFVIKIQARSEGRIIASRSLSALRKDVTGYLYGGDVTRKKKLLEKQKKGKERRGEHAKAHIPPDVFLKMVKPDSS